MTNVSISALVVAGSAVALVATVSCGTTPPSGFAGFGDSGVQTDGSVLRDGALSSGSETGVLVGSDSGDATTMKSHDSGLPCPPGLSCNVSCTGGGTTTITGKVYDPAKRNPIYNVAVYVPATPLKPLPKGVLTGADACSCDALFTSGALANTTTGVDGTFKLENVPAGTAVPLVIQIGKWRRQFTLNVGACTNNIAPDRSLSFLGSIPAGDTVDSMPDIAVSTGNADTLECLMIRVGVAASEYVPGAGSTGHVHVFSGGDDGSGGGNSTGGGTAEDPPMMGAPTSWTALWDKPSDMMPYDVVLLSCEGDETFNSNPPVLESYLNAGGRAFGSHYHYAWFAGSISGENVPSPPADWGSNLADWGAQLNSSTVGEASVVQTLTGTNKPFPKGAVFKEWLSVVGALGAEGVAASHIPIIDENQDVGAARKAQAWLVDKGWTDYLSFDTPLNAPNQPDGGPPQYCGRAVFSDIHVSADSIYTTDSNPPPGGCGVGELSPQEKALEFMLFDLSSCVVSDTVSVPLDAGFPPIPK